MIARAARSHHAASPIAFLHGLGGSKHDWDETIKHFHGRTHAVALDLPGTKVLDGGLDPTGLAEWVLAELAKKGAGPAHLIGHSLGARVAGEAAALSPKNVASISLIGPLGVTAYGFTDRLKWKAMSRSSLLKTVSDEQMRRALGYGFTRESAGKSAFVERAMTARTGRHASEVLRSLEKNIDGILDSVPLVKRLERNPIPALLIVGSNDPLCAPADVAKLHRAMPDAEIIELPRTGHYPMIEDPQRIADLIGNFIAALDRS